MVIDVHGAGNATTSHRQSVCSSLRRVEEAGIGQVVTGVATWNAMARFASNFLGSGIHQDKNNNGVVIAQGCNLSGEAVLEP